MTSPHPTPHGTERNRETRARILGGEKISEIILYRKPLSSEIACMNEMHSRAKVGGEFGANGEWYEGGKFINTVPENAKGKKIRAKPTGKREIEPYKWELQPFAGAMTLFSVLGGVEIFNRATNQFSFNSNLGDGFAAPEYISFRKANIAAYNAGERWRAQ